MPVVPHCEHQLIGDIYDASLSPALWPTVIRKIAELVDAEKANLLAYNQLDPDYFLFHSHGITPEQLQMYQDGGFAQLDHEFSTQWIGEAGIVTTNHHHFGDIDNYKRAAGRLYSDFFSRVGVLYQIGSVLEKTDFRWSVLGLHRSDNGQPFAEEYVAVVARLVPHLRRALEIHRQLTALNRQNQQLYALLDQLTTGVLLLDGNGRIRHANPRAEQLLRSHDALRVNPHHALHATDPAQNSQLQHLIRQATCASRRENLTSEAGGVLGILRQHQSPLMLTATPLSSLAGYQELRHDGIVCALFLTDPAAGRTLSRRLLKQSWALTERECDLCQAFLNHAGIEAAADACGLSLATARTYLKSIYGKTGQHSQPELMRLLMGTTTDFEHIR